MKRMTKILSNSNDKNKPAISSSTSATSLPRKSDEAPHLDLNLTTENSFGGGIRAAAAAAGRDSPAPAPASGAPTNLASIPEARQQAYFDLPAMASTPNLPIYSTMPRTPMALSPHATGQTTMMSQPADMQSIGQMGAVQYLANPTQPKTSPSRPQSNRASPSQDAVTSAAAAASPVERADLHKSLKSLEVLLVQLDEYRELQSTLAKVEKKLFKSCAELAKNNKGVIASAPAAALQHSAAIFEAQHEVSSKHAKMVQKEYEALNEACAKYFKKVAKEERTHEDLVQNLEIKVRKVQSTYDGKKAQSGPRALEAHDRYIATMSGLTNDIAKAKSSHAASIGVKSHSTALLVASTVGGLAEASFRAQCETVRRSGPSVGPLASSVNFCASEAMPTNMPLDLTEDEVGMAAHYAVAEAQAAEAQRLAREAALHQVRQQAVSDWKQQHDEQQQQYAALAAQVMHSGQDPSVALSEKHQGSRQQQLLAAALPRLDSSGREIGDGNGRDFRVGASYYQNEAPNQPKRAGTVVEEDEEEDEQEASKAAATGSRAVSASSVGPSGLRAASSASAGMQRETSAHSRHSQAAEPTFIDHGASKEESATGAEEVQSTPMRDVKSATPSPSPSLQREASQQSQTASLSAGGASAAGSGSAISSLSSSSSTTAASPYPRTPDEGEALPGAFPPTSSTAALSVPPAVPEESEAAAGPPSPAAASMPRFASPRPIRGSPSPTPTPTPSTTKPAPAPSTTAAPSASSSTLSPSPSVKHKWEQERERSLAKQREAELEKRLREAEDRLRLVERANVPPAASTSSSTLLPPRQPMPHRRDSAPMPVGVGTGAYPSSLGSMVGTRPGMGAPRSVSGTYGLQQQHDERARQQPRAVSPQPLYRQEASQGPATASSSTDSANSHHLTSSHMYRPSPRDRDRHLTPPYDSRDRRHATPPDERDRRDDLQYHAAQQRQRRRQSSTESERSFVARMKAHYQAEREKNTPSSSPYRADAAAAAGRRGSVSPYDEGRDERGYGGGGGGRGNGEKQWRRATMQVPPPASQSQTQSQARSDVGEFGEYPNSQRRAPSPYDHQPPPQQQRRPSGYLDGGGDGYGGGPSSLSIGREAPRHSDICGCQSCSARHYATDSVKARSAAAAAAAVTMSGGSRGGEMGGRGGGEGRGMTTGRVSGGGSGLFGVRR